ncbi:UTRA domain-containing protein [Streptomyces odonnellii]|uniref:UTRA domain-containing protein n=1 Tax=Streptomyces odonnellii TaxID=1417980 RepID=UPI000AB82056
MGAGHSRAGAHTDLEAGDLVLVRRRLRFVGGQPWSTEDSYCPDDLVKNTLVAEPADIPEGVIAYMASMGYARGERVRSSRGDRNAH